MTTQPDQSNTEAPEGDDTSGGGLRKQLEKALAENKDHKQKERTRAFTDAGFDTSKGLGKAISQIYEGESSAEAVLAFAETEYGHTPTASDGSQPHPQAAQIALGQHQLDQVGNVAGSMQQTTQPERLATARATGDFESEGAIMAAQMQAMMDAQARPQQ
ncbi:MAG: hypothetical protein DRQ39_00855 [Gammaproteobacteria bacterium]|nr:MAG: hypothetical protein DRQ39_00855 [Gammaproteobacteria bacterium]RKZ96180.1 MAG: hypothetical protein DRQ40_01720 [Gammaproteobacteria bacterium]